jgi:hypothetical protein
MSKYLDESKKRCREPLPIERIREIGQAMEPFFEFDDIETKAFEMCSMVNEILAARDTQGRGDLPVSRESILALEEAWRVYNETEEGVPAMLDALRAFFAQEPQPSPWNYDMGQAPRDGTRILAVCDGEVKMVRQYLSGWNRDEEHGWWEIEHDPVSYGSEEHPAAWMPLPTAPSLPKGKEQES